MTPDPFKGLATRDGESSLFRDFLSGRDFSAHSQRASINDLRKLVAWFVEANREPFSIERLTMRDLVDFRNYLRQEKEQSVATVNRALVSVRTYLTWLVDQGHLPANVAKGVKQLSQQQLAPKGMDRASVRKLLREVELCEDIRANAIFHLLLYTGCRVSDVVYLELDDLVIAERSGSVVFRNGKGGKQRSVPLPLPARKAMKVYLDTRPPVASPRVFIGERGPLTDRGIRNLCKRYGAAIGVHLHPHLLRHTMAHQFLKDTHDDLADQPWRDWYESGMEPIEAAREALANEGYPTDEE